MEFALNAFWVLVGFVSFLLWWPRESRARTSRRNRYDSLCRVATLACALVFLFPVISLTDDLHPEPFVVEEGNFSRRALRGKGHHHASLISHPPAPPPVYMVLPDLFSFRSVVIGSISPIDTIAPTAVLVRPSEGRAPPYAFFQS